MAADRKLCNAFLAQHPVEAAQILETLPVPALARFFTGQRPQAAATALEHVSPDVTAECLSHMTPRAAGRIITAFHPDYRLVVLRQAGRERREAMLESLAASLANQTRRLLAFAPGSIGRLMEPFAMTAPQDISAGDALAKVRKAGQPVRFYLYVVDRDFRLQGVLSLYELLRAPRQDPLSSVMNRDPVHLHAGMAQTELLKSRHWWRFDTLPVVDGDGVFLGIIRNQSLAQVRDELDPRPEREQTLDTLLALGELYWMGLAGVMDGIAARGERDDATDSREAT